MAHLYKQLRIHQIFGSNTDVGKTVLTTALIRASASTGKRVYYLKPVSTGPLQDADDLYVQRYAKSYANVHSKCLYQFSEPVSPHLAARLDKEQRFGHTAAPSDKEFIYSISAHLYQCAAAGHDGRADFYLETAGGVHSPTLSGTTQVDGYRPLRLPTILVGDSKLGGISSTISSYESLILRGYTVDAIMLFRDDRYLNWEYLTPYFAERGVHVEAFAPPPLRAPVEEDNFKVTAAYYKEIQGTALKAVQHLDAQHTRRLEELESMPRRTLDSVWWPFVQHGLVKGAEDVTVIDSAYGDFFSIYETTTNPGASVPPSSLRAQLDGSASWWTQTFGHAHPSLALAAARAAGRYGHVMFPQAAHLPALRLVERMLAGPGRGWAARAFFSDDGSTAMEIALKMALRAYTVRHADTLAADAIDRRALGVLGLRGSYHGDTIGAMDACDAGDGVYTCEWHNSKGYWFDPPSVAFRDGRAVISLPTGITAHAGIEQSDLVAESLSWIYDVNARIDTPLATQYRNYINGVLNKLYEQGSPRLAALVLEPLVMGAGGMIFVDPLFQRVLIDVVRGDPQDEITRSTSPAPAWRGLPVIFDEVFVGLYRIGVQSCAPLLGAAPDIAVYAKTLTGGLVPLALTLASNSIFEAFLSDKKADALLHGHSYTAHAVGCEVANEALAMMEGVVASDAWAEMRAKWDAGAPGTTLAGDKTSAAVWSFWDPEFVTDVSCLEIVSEVMTLGTVLAIKLKDSCGGYQSQSAQTILAMIIKPKTSEQGSFGIHFRTLGDVAYFMSSLNTDAATMRLVEGRIYDALNEQS